MEIQRGNIFNLLKNTSNHYGGLAMFLLSPRHNVFIKEWQDISIPPRRLLLCDTSFEISCITKIMIKYIGKFPSKIKSIKPLLQAPIRKIKSKVCKKHISEEAAACQNREHFPLMCKRLGEEKILSRVVPRKASM